MVSSNSYFFLKEISSCRCSQAQYDINWTAETEDKTSETNELLEYIVTSVTDGIWKLRILLKKTIKSSESLETN